MATTVHYALGLDEGKDALFQPQTELVGGTPAVAVFEGRGPIHLSGGLYPGNPTWSMQPFGERLYVANGRGNVHSYNGEYVTRAGIEPPLGKLQVEVDRREIRVPELGAIEIDTGELDQSTSQLTADTVEFTEADVGRLVVIPSESDMANTGDPNTANPDGPDYFGIITAVDTAALPSPTVTLSPAVAATQNVTTTGAVTRKVQFSVFDAKGDDFQAALATIERSTPYGTKRLYPSGSNNTTAGISPVEQLTDPDYDLAKALDFRGGHAIEISNLRGAAAGEVPHAVTQDVVLDFKCYLRLRTVETAGGGARVLFEKRDDPDTGTWELAIVESGKIRFRFWDKELGAFRSIQTVGRCLTSGETYYLRFRYKFKAGGKSVLDGTGGWEPDNRWVVRGGSGRNSSQFRENFRDCLMVWACEGRNPADWFLTIPGMHNAWSDTGANPWSMARNISRSPGNTGLMRDEPWIGPERGTNGFDDDGYSASELKVAHRINVTSVASVTDHQATVSAAAGMWLPRWFSQNRDEAIHDGSSAIQINEAANNRADAGSPGTGVLSNADKYRAVLCYVYRKVGGTDYNPPRIFAVRHVGNTDLGNSSRDGSGTSTLSLTNAQTLGGDGDVALPDGTGEYVVAFCLPNGRNHAPGATGNTDPVPTLLVQGENPVGKDDAPEDESRRIRIGSPEDADLRSRGFLPLDGVMADVGFSVWELDKNNAVYSGDMMAPDVDFHGPTDTRVMSLPRLCFRDLNVSRNSDDVTNADNDCERATWSARFENDVRERVVVAKADARTSPATVAEGVPKDGRLVKTSTKVQAFGKHRVAVTFYDPDQDVESPPSEPQDVEIEAQEDDDFFTAATAIRLSNVPISSDRRPRLWRRIYKTVPGADDVFLLALEVRDNSSPGISIAPDLVELAVSIQQDFQYQNPPRCGVLRATERHMLFGGLREAPRAVAWSDGFAPERVPGTNREVLESNDGNPVSALVYVSGQAYAMTRDSFHAIDLVQEGVLRAQRLQSNTGAVAHAAVVEYEDQVVFLAEKGIYAFDGTSRLLYLSPGIEQTYRSLEPASLPRSVGAYARLRNQYLFTGSLDRKLDQTLLLTMELPDSPLSVSQGVKWSKQVFPMGLTALAAVDEPDTDEQYLVAGTAQGFAVRLDVDNGCRLHERGSLYGSTQLTLAGTLTGDELDVSSGTIDTTRDGLAGVPFVIVRQAALASDYNAQSTGDELIAEGVILDAGGSKVRVLYPGALPSLQANDVLHVGGWTRAWTSKWFDYRSGAYRARDQYLDVVFEPEAGGFLRLDVYQDFQAGPERTQILPMDKGFVTQRLEVRSSFMRFRIQRVGTNRPVEIYQIAMRYKNVSTAR